MRHPSPSCFLITGILIGALSACGSDNSTKPAAVGSITVSAATMNLTVGQTDQLTATVKDTHGTPMKGVGVIWKSGDTTVITVNDSGLATAVGAGSTSVTATADTASSSVTLTVAAPTPIQLVIGSMVGDSTFPNGDTQQGGQNQTVDTIPCHATDTVNYHIHGHVSLFVNGKQLAIPLGIGIMNPIVVTNGFPDGFAEFATCFYWIHTHDASGVVHVEAPHTGSFTLGELFDIWGEPLSTTDVAGYQGPVTVFVNGQRYNGDPRAIVFSEHLQITLEVGSPIVPPPSYLFPFSY